MSHSREYLKVSLVIILTVLTALPIVTYPLGPDQGIFATGGREILHGGSLYVDLWDFKPPAIFYVYSLFIGILGESVFAIRIIDLALFPPLAFGLYWITKQLTNPNTGKLAIVGFGLLYFTESYWTLTQNEGIALVPMVLMVALLIKALDADQPAKWMFASGIMAGIAFWFKYPFAIMPALLLFGYLLHSRKGIFAFVAGGTLILVLGLAFLQAIGVLDEMYEIFNVTLTYTQGESFPDVIWNQALKDRWAQWGMLVPLSIIGLIFARRLSTKHRIHYLIIWLWLIASILIMLVQRKGYDYHWLPILPPALILSAFTVYYFLPSKQFLYATIIGGLLILQFSQIWLPAWDFITQQEDQITYYDQFGGGAFVADDMQQVVDYLKDRTTYGDSLFVYGFRSEIYYLSGLYPATRYVFQVPLVGEWYPVSWREENVAQLWATLPPYVVVAQGDYIPWMTGRDADSFMLMREDTELINWLIYNYDEAQRIGTFIIWARKE